SFGQLWNYRHEGWARRFFDNWRNSLKWQRLKPYERFAEMIERHWDGIAAYCMPQIGGLFEPPVVVHHLDAVVVVGDRLLGCGRNGQQVGCAAEDRAQ
ncbi:MAG: transposase, partial [Acidobacteriia bacterium]|nr:transposase [Terriglobia bacterium]